VRENGEYGEEGMETPGIRIKIHTAKAKGIQAKYKNGSRTCPKLPKAGPAIAPMLKATVRTLISTPRCSFVAIRAARGKAAAQVAEAAIPWPNRHPSREPKPVACQNPSETQPKISMPTVSRLRSPQRSTSSPKGKYRRREIRPYDAYSAPNRVSPKADS